MKILSDIDRITLELKQARANRLTKECAESDALNFYADHGNQIISQWPVYTTTVSHDDDRNCQMHNFFGRYCPWCESKRNDYLNPIQMGR